MNNNIKKYLAIATLSLTSTTAIANDLFLDLSDDSFHARLDTTNSAGSLNYLAEGFITEDDGSAINVGLMKTGKLNNQNIESGLGAKLMYLDTDTDSYFALGLGGSLAYSIPRTPRMSVAAELFYAPSVTTTDDLKNVTDANLRVDYQLFENGKIYGGVRLLQVEDELNVKTKIDNGLHIGIKLSF